MNGNCTNLVFVYGTLKRGLGNHHVMTQHEGAEFIGEDSMPGFEMYDLGPFPCVVTSDDQGAMVHGEVFLVDRDTMAGLDCLEGYPHHYNRVQRETAGGHVAWIYHYNRPQGQRVESGTWEPRTRQWLD